MTKKHSRSFYVFIIALIVVIAAVLIGTTFAYFTAKGDPFEDDITFGHVTLNSNSTYFTATQAINTTFIPGQALLTDDVDFSIAATSEPAYIRAKYTFTTTSTNETNLAILADLNNITFATNGTGYKWVLQTDGFYYLTNASNVPLEVNAQSGELVFISTVSSANTASVAYDALLVDTETPFKLTITIEAIQTRNITATIAAVQAAFEV